MDDDPGWKWNGSKEITLATVMLVLIIIVAILAIWNYVTLKRRREEAAVRREVLLIARHAEAKEARKVRRGLIQEALMSSTAADCECTHSKNGIRRTFSTVTLATENMSVLSCDAESQAIESQENSRDEHGGQMCPICLEDYVAGDNVSWSRYQNCHHAFHKTCIEGWLKQLDREGCCPFCRGPYLIKSKDFDERDNENDVESQQINSVTDPSADPAADEQVVNEKDQCNECSDMPDKSSQSINPVSKTTKTKPVYNSFCIVHGLLR